MSIIKPEDFKSDTSENESDVDETDSSPLVGSKKVSLKPATFDAPAELSDDENDGLSEPEIDDEEDDVADDVADEEDDDDDGSDLGASNNEPDSNELNIFHDNINFRYSSRPIHRFTTY